jgi:predicted O-methyltransferase YrrM
LGQVLGVVVILVGWRSLARLNTPPFGGGREQKMDETLAQLFTELEQFGEANDKSTADRSQRMLNITRDTGEFLSVIVRAMYARQILEIGTSNGYSTLWLASAARAIGGRVSTIEISDFKIELAEKNFMSSGLNSVITQIRADADRILANMETAAFDLIFLDSVYCPTRFEKKGGRN